MSAAFYAEAAARDFHLDHTGGGFWCIARVYPAQHGCALLARVFVEDSADAPARWDDGPCVIDYTYSAPDGAPAAYIEALEDICQRSCDAYVPYASTRGAVDAAEAMTPAIVAALGAQS